jgi:hypothetical protein
MPASSSSPTDPVLAFLLPLRMPTPVAGADLLARLAEVADPRKRRGVPHQITTILAVARGTGGRLPLENEIPMYALACPEGHADYLVLERAT